MKRLKRGRPHGHVPLAANPRRFAIATWWALHDMTFGPIVAAYLAGLVAEMERPFEIKTIKNKPGVLSSELWYQTSRMDRYAVRLTRYAREAIGRADDIARAWLAHSAGLIQGIARFSSKEDWNAVRLTLDMLAAIDGWRDVIERLGTRLAVATEAEGKSELVFGDKGPSRAVKRLLKAMGVT